MSKVNDNDKAKALFKKSSQSAVAFKEGFEERELSRRESFRAEFISAPLSEEESLQIHRILETSVAESQFLNEEIEADHLNLSKITTEIRAIEKQSVLLHGERISKAQSILKKYGERIFSKWLMIAYGNRQTPYRYLYFYDLFNRLEKDEKELMNAMPKKAAYELASRMGDVEKKVEIIKEHYDSPSKEIIQIVQETFPLAKEDKRKASKRVSDVELLQDILFKIRKLKDKKSLQKVLVLVEKLLADPIPMKKHPDQIDIEEYLD